MSLITFTSVFSRSCIIRLSVNGNAGVVLMRVGMLAGTGKDEETKLGRLVEKERMARSGDGKLLNDNTEGAALVVVPRLLLAEVN